MHSGKVKFYNENKSFGFIIENETLKEVFVHSSGLIDKVNKNDEVTFELASGKKGPTAINVKLKTPS